MYSSTGISYSKLTDWLTEQLSEMNGMEWEKPNKQMNRWRDGQTRENMISVNMQIFSLNNINIFWKEMNSVHSLTTSLMSFKYIVALTKKYQTVIKHLTEGDYILDNTL